VAQSLKPGEHGTTFGGGPLACRLALEVLDVIADEDLLRKVSENGTYLLEGLRSLSTQHRSVGEIRGLGLMIGVELGSLAKSVVQKLLKHGVIANAAHDTVLRLLPPFVITRADIDQFLEILDSVLTEAEAEEKASAAAAKGA